MKYTGKWAGIVVLIVIIVGNLWQWTQTDVSALAAAEEVPTAVAQTIRQATVQITMIQTQWHEASAADTSEHTITLSSVRHIDKGIGTLLAYEDETLLISHDHWSYLTSTAVPDLVQFHDADGRFLLEMTGDAFRQLILFHDGGSLIMRAPQSLRTQLPNADLGHTASLQPGDIVYVAHRQANQKETVVLMAAEVLAIEFRNSIPLLSLRSLNGETIEPGDSGGGVWVNDGRFVGNMWMTIIEVQQDWWRFYQPMESTTVRSYAAGMTEDLLELVSIVLESQELPQIQTNSPS